VQLTFGDGSVAHLEDTHPCFDTLMAVMSRESGQCRPVGVMLEASGRVLDVSEAHDVTVRYLRAAEDHPDRLQVALWGFSPLSYLSRDHPEFERIRSTLTAAAGTATRLWVANYSQMVQDEPATEDGEFEVWWKVMDVRPVEPTDGFGK
jgi:hypothetical protein